MDKMTLHESMQWAWAMGCQLRKKALRSPADTFAFYVDEDIVDSAVLRGVVVSLWHATDDRGKEALHFSLPASLVNLCALSEHVVIGPGPEWTAFLFGQWAALHDDRTLGELARRLVHRDGSSAAIAAGGLVQNVVSNVVDDVSGYSDALMLSFFNLVFGSVLCRKQPRIDFRPFPAVAGLPVVLDPLQVEPSFLGAF